MYLKGAKSNYPKFASVQLLIAFTKLLMGELVLPRISLISRPSRGTLWLKLLQFTLTEVELGNPI